MPAAWRPGQGQAWGWEDCAADGRARAVHRRLKHSWRRAGPSWRSTAPTASARPASRPTFASDATTEATSASLKGASSPAAAFMAPKDATRSSVVSARIAVSGRLPCDGARSAAPTRAVAEAAAPSHFQSQRSSMVAADCSNKEPVGAVGIASLRRVASGGRSSSATF